MDRTEIENIINDLKQKDDRLRSKLVKEGSLSDGYNKQMEALHISNAMVLNNIIDQIGYPTISKVGKNAADNAWLIIQHAISLPEFMKKCATQLEYEVNQENADPQKLAYLKDRISVFQGEKQIYGTQFDWDDNNEMSPNNIQDVSKVNELRKSIGLNTIEEQTKLIRKRVADENQSPPPDRKKRRVEFDQWRKKVGWIKT